MMSEVSIELVPRDLGVLEEALDVVEKYSDEFVMINIPDLLRFPVRSWEGCIPAQKSISRVLPHLRSMDFDATGEFKLAEFFSDNNIDEVLVISGDPPKDENHPTFETTPIDLCRQIKASLPEAKVYGAIDQFRGTLEEELAYVERKIEGDMDGFFTQPFFSLEQLAEYAERLDGKNVYFGISPVTSENSMRYWERTNHVVFPKDFEPTIEWNAQFAREVIEYCKERNFNVYLMPIKTDLDKYLDLVFA